MADEIKVDTASDSSDSSVLEGNGPGGSYVGLRGVILLLIYVIFVISGVLWGIHENLPECASLLSNTNKSTGNSANMGKNSNAGKNTNANTGGNANANATPTKRKTKSNANIVVTNSNNANTTANASVGENTNTDASENADTSGNTNSNANIKIASISPVRGFTNGNTLVLIKGSGFGKDTKVLFDGLEADKVKLEGGESETVSGESLFVKTPEHAATESVDVIVRNPRTGDSDVLSSGFTYSCSQIPLSKLLLIVIFAGALGGALHALRSLYWYVGNRELIWSWTPMYLLLPFSGAAIASVFYLVVYSGFLTAPSDRQTYWYIIGIAVIVGMFSQQAALKLQDIANAALTKPGEGSNAKPQKSDPVNPRQNTGTIKPVFKIDPRTGGGGTVTISGTGFNNITEVTVGGNSAKLTKVPNSSNVQFEIPPGASGASVEILVYFDGNPNPEKLTYIYGE